MTLMEKSLFYSQLAFLLLQFIVTSSAIKTETNITTDQFALLSLKSQIISDPFQLLAKSWSQDTPVCNWIGVTCGSRHHRVTSLNISNMGLTGTIPQYFGNLTFLVSLDFTSNNFYGNLPQEMARLRRLKFMRLSFNNLSGEVPSWFGFLAQLQVLTLTNNSFAGLVPSSLSNISNLATLDLAFNALEGKIPKDIGNLKNVRKLHLEGNNLTGYIPPSFSNASKLETLVLSHNFLLGNIPNGIGDLHNLNWLGMEANQLTGSIPFSIFNISTLESIGFSGNSLSGNLPTDLCDGLPILKGLYLSLNKLQGHMPPSLSRCYELQILSLSSNEFDGPIPREIGKLSNLQILYIGVNRFTGEIPQEIGDLVNLVMIGMEKNQLTGSIPKSMFNITSLQLLSLEKNNLTGSLPREIGNLTMLQDLYLGGNKLTGEIPKEVSNLIELEECDLQDNRFSGSFPIGIFNISGLRLIDLTEFGNLKAAIRIDLSQNQFSKGIPREIGDLQNLIHLSLAQNKLQGSIPDSIGSIPSLEFLDLSNNNLSGSIPMSLENLRYLNYFNVSFNSLHGEIPSSGPFKDLSGQSFMFNEALCGAPRFHVPPCPTSSNHRSKRKKLLLIVFPLLGAAVIIVFITLAFVWKRYRREGNVPVQADLLATRGRISYYEIVQATNDFSESNSIGSGSFGSVYKGILRDGTTIAVKVFNLQVEGAFKSFETECEVLRNLRHRNLTKVISSCSNLDFKALVLEYMPNGSLEKWLYSHNYFLDIIQRLSIMIDVACALEYLHHGCSAPVIHCDLKPSNVLLDENMVAHVSDFGISKLLGEDESDLHTKTLATLGYIAPEYGREGLVSLKCDVYSYGIMLMETFTRRRPNDEIFDGDLSLKKWVSDSLPEAEAVVDANLLKPKDKKFLDKIDCVKSIMKVALDCSAESPNERINMKDVVRMLQKIKIQLLSCSAST